MGQCQICGKNSSKGKYNMYGDFTCSSCMNDRSGSMFRVDF